MVRAVRGIRWAAAVRYMRRQKGACLSAFVVAMLAVTVFLGIRFTAFALQANANRYWNERAYHDIEIVAPTLLTEEDLNSIRATEGVADAEGVLYTSAAVVSNEDASLDVISLTERIDTVALLEGRIPRTADECLLERPALEALGLSVGDRIELDGAPSLSVRTFTVCGVADHANHPCTPLQVPGNRYAIVRPEAFDAELLKGRFMQAVVRIDGAERDYFSDSYLSSVGPVCSRLDTLSRQPAPILSEPADPPDLLQSWLARLLSLMGRGGRWLILDAWGSTYYYAIRSAAENAAAMGATFAVVFVIVGALIVYASIRRMVEEDRTSIGTAKAMGFRNGEIARKYLFVGLLPAAAGMLAGIVAGYAGIQSVMLSIYGRFYVYGSGSRAFLPGLTLAVCGAGLLIAALAAGAACASLLRKPAVRLMNDRSPEASPAFRKSRTSGRFPFFSLILRSLRTGWRRILVIVAGIAGCTILLVTGFTIRLAVSQTVDRQFSNVELYDLKIRLPSGEEAEDQAVWDRVRSVLTENGLDAGAKENGWIELTDRDCLFQAGGWMNGGELIVADPDQLDGYFSLRDAVTGEPLTLSASGIYIHLRTAETADLSEGDRLGLFNSRMIQRLIPVSGVFGNYVGGQLFLSREAYESVFRETPRHDCIWVRCGTERLSGIRSALSGLPVTLSDSQEKKQEYKGYTSALDMIALVLAGMAALMAGGVLANLIYLQYYRKKRTLVILRINGFSGARTVGYVLGESVFTHLAGMILGIAGGSLLARRIIGLMEGRQLHIVRSVQPLGWLFACLVMLFFSILIHAVVVRAALRLKPTEDVMIR